MYALDTKCKKCNLNAIVKDELCIVCGRGNTKKQVLKQVRELRF